MDRGGGNGHQDMAVDTEEVAVDMRRWQWTQGSGSGHRGGGTGHKEVAVDTGEVAVDTEEQRADQSRKATRTAPRGDFKVSDFSCISEPCTNLPHFSDMRQH